MALTEAEIQEIIDGIDAAIISLVSGKIKRYRIGRREFERYDLQELRELRDYYNNLAGSIPVEEVTVYDDTDT